MLKLHFTSPPAPFFHIAVFSLCHHLRRDLRKHQARGKRDERACFTGAPGEWGMKRRNSFVILPLEKKVAWMWNYIRREISECFAFFLPQKIRKKLRTFGSKTFGTWIRRGKEEAFLHEPALRKHNFFGKQAHGCLIFVKCCSCLLPKAVRAVLRSVSPEVMQPTLHKHVLTFRSPLISSPGNSLRSVHYCTISTPSTPLTVNT